MGEGVGDGEGDGVGLGVGEVAATVAVVVGEAELAAGRPHAARSTSATSSPRATTL